MRLLGSSKTETEKIAVEQLLSGGQRLRPFLALLAYEAFCPQPEPAVVNRLALSVECFHKASLIHDDIEDNSPTRRGRLTVWTKWGMPMAVNAGDALFVIAHQAIMDLSRFYPPDVVVRTANTLQSVCLDLTCGQYLDMSFEGRTGVTEDEYWRMISGKTAALLSAACSIGSILGTSDERIQEQYANFGRDLGLAFQVQDDMLGIWGDESATGKSAASDLVEGKNSLPILYGIGKKSAFAARWAAGPIKPEETQQLAQMLKDEGAYAYCQHEAERLTSLALVSLQDANPKGEAGEALVEMAGNLLNRKS